MSKLEQYLQAAVRENTRQSYRAAVEHYEVTWGGLLPATPEQIARYLADFGATLAQSTLKQRLAALAQWHREQGFADPTQSPVVKNVLKGIAEVHPQRPKQAKPLQLETLEVLDQWFERAISHARQTSMKTELTRLYRDKAMVFIGFWRAFRSDELCRLRIEHILIRPDKGMTIYLPRSKTDRQSQGRSYNVPELSRLCPVTAYKAWLSYIGREEGPVFCKIDRWGSLGTEPLHVRSVIPMLRRLFKQAGIQDAQTYSSHSLRRGFASWAGANRWELQSLMDYVGWKTMQSALQYLETDDPFAQRQIEQTLQENAALPSPPPSSPPGSWLEVQLVIERFHARVESKRHVQKALEQFCLATYQLERTAPERGAYRIFVPHHTMAELHDIVDDLIHQMQTLANDRHCMVEITVTAPQQGLEWH